MAVHNQLWITSAVSDADVPKALTLCCSLRRTFTRRKIAILASTKISPRMMQALEDGFDIVLPLDERRNTGNLEIEDYVKIYPFLALRSFDNCVYLCPTMLALKNSDDLFLEPTDGMVMLDDNKNTSVFLFKPSAENYHSIMNAITCMKKSSPNISGLSTCFTALVKEEREGKRVLDGKYGTAIENGKPIFRFDQDIAMVNLIDSPTDSSIKNLEETGLLEKLIATYWLKIQREDVLQLINGPVNTSGEIYPRQDNLIKYNKEPVAVVGMSCRLPGSNNLEDFWNLLFEGQDGTCKTPPFRWQRDQCLTHRSDYREMNAGFLKNPVDEFDAKFFGISPKEVLYVDPQNRLLHELTWEALEDACINPHSLRGTFGSVFMGSWLSEYKEILMHSSNTDYYREYVGNSIGSSAARISFLLGMMGPSIATESGCSSAMVAVHMACKSLRLGETNMALACGVNMILNPPDGIATIVSPDGRCKTFSENANGFARAEGGGVLVLKRLSDAVKDGDRIWGLIRGSAMCQEGMSQSLGTPTVHCESTAMKRALLDSDVSPDQVSFVEAHGSGTIVGDPLEVAAIAKAYRSSNRKEPLIIGSGKTNVGHTESCSGITGILKVILSLHHEVIPAHLNFTKLNPAINIDAIPAVIPLKRMEWKRNPKLPRIAGVSSFGITGTDAHVIIEESPGCLDPKILTVSSDLERPLHLLKLSAKSNEAMDKLLQKYQNSVEFSDENITDITYSANTGRADFPIRAAIIAKTNSDIATIIKKKSYLRGEAKYEDVGKVCFLFTGQGSQYPGMAKQIYESSPVFRMHFDYCDKILSEQYNIRIMETLWPDNTAKANNNINKSIFQQAGIFCIEYALAKLWESWGVKPDYVLGHSLGEFASAVCAGMMSAEDGIKLIAERSMMLEELPSGKMMAIMADRQKVDQAMKSFASDSSEKMLDYAAVNSMEQTVVSGDSDVVQEFYKYCLRSSMKCQLLNTSHAFHSKHVDPLLERYRTVAQNIPKPSGKKCRYISGLLGDLVHSDGMDADYWVRQTREAINFLDASRKSVELGCNIFIEIGPQAVLSALTMANNGGNILCLPSIKKTENEWSTLLTSLAKLYIKGIEIDWKGVDMFYSRKKVRLPQYPFIGRKFWPEIVQYSGGGSKIHPLLGSAIPNASNVKLFESGINLKTHVYLRDHSIGRHSILPAAGYLEMCMAAGLASIMNTASTLSSPTVSVKIENLNIESPLVLDDSKITQIQTVLDSGSKEKHNMADVQIFHRHESSWVPHANATFSKLPSGKRQVASFDVQHFHENTIYRGDNDDALQFYKKLATVGLQFGPHFRSLRSIWRNGESGAMLARVNAPSDVPQHCQYIIHPIILDAMLQTMLISKLASSSSVKLHVPIKIGKFVWFSGISENATSSEMYIHTAGDMHGIENKCCSLLIDSMGNVLAEMSQVEFAETTAKALESIVEQHLTTSMPDMWEEVWRPTSGSIQHLVNMNICPIDKESMDLIHRDNNLEKINDRPDIQTLFFQLDKLSFFYIVRTMLDLGWNPTINTEFNEEHLFQELNIATEFRKQFGYFLRVLEDERILSKVDSQIWRVICLPPSWMQLKNIISSVQYTSELVETFGPTLLLSKVGNNLESVLKGTETALSLLFPKDGSEDKDSSAGELYNVIGKLIQVEHLPRVHSIAWLENYKREAYAAGHEDFVFRILEVGAGTGGYTEPFLEILEECGIEYEYTYTDISSAFFPAAEKRFEKYLKKIKFGRLNIEEDPISQGYVPSSYDFVIAFNVIHATKTLKESLRNIRTLLKPNGHFDICEMTRDHRFITFMFGLLDGFWRFEDYDTRQNHCVISKRDWIKALEETGFEVAGAFHFANDHVAYIKSKKSSDAVEAIPDNLTHNSEQLKYWLIFHQPRNSVSNYISKNIPQLVANRQVISVITGNNFERTSANSFFISREREQDSMQLLDILETEAKVIEGVVYCWSLDETMNAQEVTFRPYFLLAKSILQSKQNMRPRLYLMTGGAVPVSDDIDLPNFHYRTLWGFTKSLANENTDIFCKCIDVGPNANDDDMLQILYELWKPEKEIQVAFLDGKRYVPKLVAHQPINNRLELPTASDRFQLVLAEGESTANMKFKSMVPVALAHNEVEIQVKASTLNDCIATSSKSGLGFAGIVKAIGSNVTKWTVGDAVLGFSKEESLLTSHICMREDHLIALPTTMTFAEASTIASAFLTSIRALIDVANISGHDAVLIHDACNGTGLYAIQICKHVGAAIIATAGSRRQQNYLKSLGVQNVFNLQDSQCEEEIMTATNGLGIGVVLNCSTDQSVTNVMFNVCRKSTRFLEINKMLSLRRTTNAAQVRPDVKYSNIDII